MKKLTTILFLAITYFSMAQDWFSISASWTQGQAIVHLSIDENTNTITYNTYWGVEVLKGDGTSYTVSQSITYPADYNLGDVNYYMEKSFYYIDRLYLTSWDDGLRKIMIEPVFKDTILYQPGIKNMLIDHDTLWLSGYDLVDASKYINESIHQPFTMGRSDLEKYKGQIYGISELTTAGGIAYHDGTGFVKFKTDNSNILSDSIGGFCTNHENGILFVGTAQGLSQFNGATFTNITPATHSEMPYKAVLDVEYDHRNGKLWMVLGDDNLTAKTLTSYDGSWETFDASNSPVDFNKFVDMVVDTLGQVWIAEEQELHVLNTNQLEGWLATEKHKKQRFDVSVYPNPSNGIINLKIAADEMVQLRIFNSKGQEVYHQDKASGIIELDLPEGIYHYTVTNDTQEISTGKFIRL